MSLPDSPRVAPPRDPVTITLDGKPFIAERGEPLATTLVAAGKLVLARSPKFHRPRGPSCFRGACDGCLARVNETPNVMTCMVAAEEGMSVVTQNRLGPRSTDLLRMTDWFFPDGMNHHELFAGIPGVQSVMQLFARRVAGLGRLPAAPQGARPAARRDTDVVVVGGGPAGMAIATRLAARGRSVELIDDQLAIGGGVSALSELDATPFAAVRAALDADVARGAIRVRSSTVAGGLYGRDLLVVGPDGAEILTASAIVLACGGHDGALAFEGNDIPGVMSARAAGWLLARGVLVGRRAVVVVPPGGGPFGASYARGLAHRTRNMPTGSEPISVEVAFGDPVRADGSSRVKAILVRTKDGEREFPADAVLLDAPRSPAYELAEQAGARLVHEARGFVVKTDGGRIAEGLFAVGEMVGVPLDATAISADAERVASRILEA